LRWPYGELKGREGKKIIKNTNSNGYDCPEAALMLIKAGIDVNA